MFNRSKVPVGHGRRRAVGAATSLAISACLVAMSTGAAQAAGKTPITPGDLLVSRAHYAGSGNLISPGVTVLPTGAVAIADGNFAHVWDNVSVDPNFGITAPVYLDQFTQAGTPVGSIAVPDGMP